MPDTETTQASWSRKLGDYWRALHAAGLGMDPGLVHEIVLDAASKLHSGEIHV